MKALQLFFAVLIPFFVFGCTKAGLNTEVNKSESVVLTLEEVAKHASEEDCWIIIRNKVYGVTDFISEHPGGSFRIIPSCGKDASEGFETQGGQGSHSQDAYQLLPEFLIGEIGATVQTAK